MPADEFIHSSDSPDAPAPRRDRFLAILAEVASLLNLADDWAEAVKQVLPLIGQTPDVDSIGINYFYQVDGSWSFDEHFHWSRASNQVTAGTPEMQGISYARFSPQWIQMLLDGQPISSSSVTFPSEEQAFLDRHAHRSVLTVPIRSDKRLWGTLRLVNNQGERPWSEEEVAIFQTVALNLGSAQSRFDKAAELNQRSRQLEERIREIQCLYEISRWADRADLTLPELFAKVIELVPEAFRWPERTRARLEIDGVVYASEQFESGSHRLGSPLQTEDAQRVQLEVSLLDAQLGQGEAFLAEEQVFLDEVNRILARVIERNESREHLIQLNAELENRVRERTSEIAAREALLHHLIDSIPDLVYYKDPQGRYMGSNRAFKAFTGKSDAELLGRRDAEIFVDSHLSEEWKRSDWSREEGLRILDDWIHVFTVLDHPLEAGEIRSREEWVYSFKGPRVYLETRKTPYCSPDGQVIGVIGISRDLTQRKLSENAMLENEAKIRQLVEGVPVGIFVMEASGQSYFANQAALELLGRGILPQGDAAQQLEGYKSFIAGTDIEYPPERNPLVRAFMYKEKCEVTDIETQLPDGRRIPLYCTGAPILDEQGELLYAVSAFSDISELKRKEEELIEAREKAESASRAKSDFLANMSHEIRTPMNAVIGLNHLLLKSGLNPKQQDHVYKVQAAAQNLLGIINDILDFSKIEAGKLRMERIPFDLHQVIVNTSNLLSMRAQEKNLELIIRLKTEMPFELVGDPLRLEQVLLNLAGNAIKFTEQGEVEITSEILEESEEQVHLCFHVRDTGIGIRPEQQSRLFQAFSQADSSMTRRYGGTGLGLMISKRLVEMMRGHISFTSEANKGSVFTFSAWFGKQRGNNPVKQLVPMELQKLRVLAVDDHQAVLQLLAEYLKGFEFEMDMALSAGQALETLDARLARGQSYDLLLMDWNLPDSNGFELIEKCWERMPNKPRTLLMTAFGRDDVLTQAESLALDGILLKPLTPSQLFDAVIQAFGGSEQLQERVSEEYSEALDPVRGARILLVEDNEINQMVARELLEAEGFLIDVARHGREALEKLIVARPDAYDIVLMDIHMPVMDGFAATRRLRELGSFESLPVVAMSADVAVGIREQVLASGMNDYITKPIVLKELFGVLARWIRPRLETGGKRPERQLEAMELPPLPGVEIEEALQRLGGNVGLYIKLLRRFAAELPDKLEELETSLARQLEAQAHQQAHTLKGTSGNLGLHLLQSRMAGIEQALKQRDWQSASVLLDQARMQLKPLLPEIAGLTPQSPPEGVPLDPIAQARLHRDLTVALQNYDPSAGELLQQLKICLEQPEHCEELEMLIDNFDFEQALDCWQALQQSLELSH